MKVDIIGGSGFIGTRLVQQLLESSNAWDVRIIDKAKSEKYPNLCTIADVRSVQQLQEAIRPNSVLINLAAEHRDDVRPIELYEQVNVEGAVNVCKVAEQKKVKTICFTSSVAVYGLGRKAEAVGESVILTPENEYGRTKLEAEKVYSAWHAKDGGSRRLVIVRPTVVFGEGNRGNVYNLMKQIASGRFVMIGEGDNKKSIAYVGNLVAFLESALFGGGEKRVFNYVDKPDYSMAELISLIRQSLGVSNRNVLKIPFVFGYIVGLLFDLFAVTFRRSFPISSVRVRKFCSSSVFSNDEVVKVGFVPPFELRLALQGVVKSEFEK